MTLGDAVSRPLSEAPEPDRQASQPPPSAGPSPTTVLNPAELQALIDNVGLTAAARFADDFLNLLGDRLTQVNTALGQADPVPALDAVLILKASASMLGAEQMTLYCSGLEAELRGLRIPHAGALPRLAADFAAVLRRTQEVSTGDETQWNEKPATSSG